MNTTPVKSYADHAVLLPADALALKEGIAEKAIELGFDLIRFTTGEPFPYAQQVLEERIDAGLLSGLPWFSKERAHVAGDPHNLMPSVATIVSLGISYLGEHSPQPSTPGQPRGRIARYAWGLDYHDVFKAKLTALHAHIEEQLGRRVEARTLADTARIVDRAVAERAGLGWYGKNTNLLSRSHGSWVLLGELLLDVALPPDEPVRTSCGACTRCMPACPTGALIAPGVLDSNRCISYLTIELKGPIPRELRPLIGDWIFGCDICQEVCPVNRKAEPGNHAEFAEDAGIGASPSLIELLDMSEETFRNRFRHSPVKRTKLEGLKRNVAVAMGNIGDRAAVSSLVRELHKGSPVVRGHCAWALGRIGGSEAWAALSERLGAESDDWVRGEIELALRDLTHGTEQRETRE